MSKGKKMREPVIKATSSLSHCIGNLAKVKSIWTGQLVSYTAIFLYLKTCGYTELRSVAQVRYHAKAHGAKPRSSHAAADAADLLTRFGPSPVKAKGVLRFRAG